MQVAGRAGRRSRPGEVLVQTRYPEHPLFTALAKHDYAGFADAQLEERRRAGFAPFVSEAALRAEARQLGAAMEFLARAARLAEAPPEVRVYDPVPHVLTRRAGFERAQLIAQSASRRALQGWLTALAAALHADPQRDVRWHIDVDPIDFV
jgi:primosomal protein N' (replication factor Y)